MGRRNPEWVRTDRIPILPRSRLYLGYDWEGDGPRFAGLFASTWRRLPLGARRSLLGYWRAPSPAREVHGRREYRLDGGGGDSPIWVIDVGEGPRIEYRRADYDEEDALGGCGGDGHRLWFNSTRLDGLPDGPVQYVVAHELAHAFQRATGRFTPAEWDRYDLENGREVRWAHDADRLTAARSAACDYAEIEFDADELAIHCWGFSDAGVDG